MAGARLQEERGGGRRLRAAPRGDGACTKVLRLGLSGVVARVCVLGKGSVVLIDECPLNARLETGVGLSFFLLRKGGRGVVAMRCCDGHELRRSIGCLSA